MTATTPGPGAVPGPLIEVQEGMPPERRRAVELSVATLVDRATEETARARAAEAERAEQTAALQRPVLELIRSDPAAAKALDGARSSPQPIGDLQRLQPRDPRIRKGQQHLIAFDASNAPEVFVIPYHFNWQWHVLSGGAPRTSFADLPSGQIGLDARADAPPDFVDVPFINAHAGFGISLSTDHEVQATARSLRNVGYSWSVGAGFLGDATVEGGEEMTAMEAGNVLDDDMTIVFHRRLSGTNVLDPAVSEAQDSGGLGTGEHMEVTWTMLPGHAYEFNVGQWVTVKRSPGIGGAGGIAQIQGTVILMTLFR
jgi:hypothetical protein